MDSEYDAVILGAGHNSLILQAYLCQAGLDVVCLERRDVAGGGLSTVEDPRHPGFLHNTHSFYHRAITYMPWYRELDLERTRTRSRRLAWLLRTADRQGKAVQGSTQGQRPQALLKAIPRRREGCRYFAALRGYRHLSGLGPRSGFSVQQSLQASSFRRRSMAGCSPFFFGVSTSMTVLPGIPIRRSG